MSSPRFQNHCPGPGAPSPGAPHPGPPVNVPRGTLSVGSEPFLGVGVCITPGKLWDVHQSGKGVPVSFWNHVPTSVSVELERLRPRLLLRVGCEPVDRPRCCADILLHSKGARNQKKALSFKALNREMLQVHGKWEGGQRTTPYVRAYVEQWGVRLLAAGRWCAVNCPG